MKDSNKVLVIGGGGREHAIIHKLKESDKVSKIYCAPGNGGITRDAECVPIGIMEFDKLVDFLNQYNSSKKIICNYINFAIPASVCKNIFLFVIFG